MTDERPTSATGGEVYFASVGDVWHELLLGPGEVRLGGNPIDADISTLPGSDRQHLRLDGRSLSLFARREPEGWVVELEGRSFRVRVEDARTRHIRELASHVAPTDTRRVLRAPMPGLVVRLEVEVGQSVETGDGLVVMEAMKMENELRAEGPGTVTSIDVEEGQAVDRDAVLLRIE